MSTRTLVSITDDLDGQEGATPVAFALDGASWVIDLAPDNETALRNALAGYISHARKVKAGAPPARSRATRSAPAVTASPSQPASAASPPASPNGTHNGHAPSEADLASVDNAAVRAWCRAQAIEVNERGRVPLALKARYLTAMGSDAVLTA